MNEANEKALKAGTEKQAATGTPRVNKEQVPLHFDTLEEYHRYYSDAIPVEEFDRMVRERYGM